MRKSVAAIAGVSAMSLALAACGGDGGGGGGGGGGDSEKYTQVRMSYDGDDFMNQMTWMVADEKYWPKLGLTEPAKVTASDEYLAGLIGGDVWVSQGESDAIWAAVAEGSVPLTIIGVAKDTEAWWMGARKGVDPDHLEGLKISGGEAGDRNITVAKNILEEMGVDPDSMDFVSVTGGSDERLQALLAGQIDAAADSSSWAEMVRQDALRLLVTWGPERAKRFPAVPTLKELGLDIVSTSPYGVGGPAGMDPAVVRVLEEAFREAAQDPAHVAVLERYDMAPAFLGTADYAAAAKAQYEEDGAMIRRLGLKAG